jgi:hypothetical protein
MKTKMGSKMSKITVKSVGFCAALMLCLIAARDANAGARRLGGGYGTAYNVTDLGSFETDSMKVRNILSASTRYWYIPLVDDDIALTSLWLSVYKSSSGSMGCNYDAYDDNMNLIFSGTSTVPTGYSWINLPVPGYAVGYHSLSCSLPPNGAIFQTYYTW